MNELRASKVFRTSPNWPPSPSPRAYTSTSCRGSSNTRRLMGFTPSSARTNGAKATLRKRNWLQPFELWSVTARVASLWPASWAETPLGECASQALVDRCRLFYFCSFVKAGVKDRQWMSIITLLVFLSFQRPSGCRRQTRMTIMDFFKAYPVSKTSNE